MSVPPVIVGVDGSESSKKALQWATDYGRVSGVPVQALVAWDRPTTYGMPVLFSESELEEQAQQTLHQEVREVLGENPVITERVEQGHAAAVLVNASKQAQLLVVGAHDLHHLARRLLGSVSLHCVQHAHCPVVVIRDK